MVMKGIINSSQIQSYDERRKRNETLTKGVHNHKQTKEKNK